MGGMHRQKQQRGPRTSRMTANQILNSHTPNKNYHDMLDPNELLARKMASVNYDAEKEKRLQALKSKV